MQTISKVSEAADRQVGGLYIRLSREDGDRTESLSVGNQRLLLQEYAGTLEGYSDFQLYIDDGYTGTNFNRPAFQQMLEDIEKGFIRCVIVKDLSRLGRNMAKVSTYIQEYFPSKRIRFIAIDDNIDRNYFDLDTSEDMMIDIKNMFNGFYPRDISKKVRATFRSKQRAGQFIGAFACYGYQKSSVDHNQLMVDKPAADVVRRIFQLYLDGYGQNTIAKKLNEERIPCPSEYKKQCGLNYHNGNRLDNTTYWTYSSIRNILRNRMYTGAMVQNRSFRQPCRKNAVPMPESEWIIVSDTHEAIISKTDFEKVQELLKRGMKHTSLKQNIHSFAGFLRCGDCGRAMTKITRKGKEAFCCGSYNRYGTKQCSAHFIEKEQLEEFVLEDFNSMLQSISNLGNIITKEKERMKNSRRKTQDRKGNAQREIQKLLHKKERAYDDYTEELLTKEEYIRYREQCDNQIAFWKKQTGIPMDGEHQNSSVNSQWAERLLGKGRLEQLDRLTVVEMIHMIYVYDNHTVKIVYQCSNENLTKNG